MRMGLLADEENNGWLSRKGVAIALRLMGWAQRGEPITAALIAKSGALPSIKGITAVVPQSTGFPVRPSPSTTTGLPPLTPADKAKYLNMFQKARPSNGLLSGLSQCLHVIP
ncbi:hypothetical protein C8J56DRAFT_197863 [Mycena floridula]|nr:hypothetical protein C8J56DRAFT_197863 [Mycena floridula]